MSTSADVVYNSPEVNSGTTTSWIPLTTPWPSSSGCASSFFLFPGEPAPVAWDPGYGYFYGKLPRCLPPAATTWWEQDHQNGDGFTRLSIRPIVCPAAFTTAATSVQAGSSTQVLCCPSGYELLNGQPGKAVGQCWSSLTPGQTLTYVGSAPAPGIFTTTLRVNSSSSISAIRLEGWNVAVPTSTSNRIPTSTATSGPSEGLSSGAKAGIGVSAAIGALGLLALVGALIILRRRPKAAEYNDQAARFVHPLPPAEVDTKRFAQPVYQPVYEMDPKNKPAELPSDGQFSSQHQANVS